MFYFGSDNIRVYNALIIYKQKWKKQHKKEDPYIVAFVLLLLYPSIFAESSPFCIFPYTVIT
jgi:hypothetical protein